MEIQLEELIEKIKKEGVEAAALEAEAIISAAKAEAEKIVNDANAQAQKIINDAMSENERMVKSSEDAIRQAGRNLLISFRESVTKQLNVILNEKVNTVYSSEELAKLIITAVENWTKNSDADNLAVIMNSQDLNALENTLLSAIKEKMLKGVTLKANDNFDGGFRIAVNNGSAYYDYSAEAVVEMLSGYLSPRVVELLKEAQ